MQDYAGAAELLRGATRYGNPQGKVYPAANYLLGLATLLQVPKIDPEAEKTKSCDLARQEETLLTESEQAFTAGQTANPEVATPQPAISSRSTSRVRRPWSKRTASDDAVGGFHRGKPSAYIDPAAGGCSSAWLECRTVTAEVAGSSPVSPALYHTPSPSDGVFCIMTYHPSACCSRRCWPRLGRPARAVDATLGDGGHAEALLRPGRRGARHRSRSRCDRHRSAPAGRCRHPLPRGALRVGGSARRRRASSRPTSCCSISACRRASSTRTPAASASVPGRRSTCA